MQQQNYELDKEQNKQKVDNREWSDIDSKLPQFPNGLYKFQPKQQYQVYYRRLLYCLQNEQQSGRAFDLTGYMLCLNTNNYYGLMLRNQCRKKQWKKFSNKQQYATNLRAELNFINCLLNQNSKQYQLWNYRKDLICQNEENQFKVDKFELQKSEEEFIFWLLTNDDIKNYHAWDYKCWLTRFVGNIEQKVQQTTDMLFSQPKQIAQGYKCQSIWIDCYSCWSYRANLIMDLPQQKKHKLLQEDAQKVLKFIYKNPQNQCSWNYLTCLVQSAALKIQIKTKIISQIYQISTKVKQQNRYAWLFLFTTGSQDVKQEALSRLIQIDPIRSLYYQYIKQNKQIKPHKAIINNQLK